MTLWNQILLLFGVALLCSISGFWKYVYFISLGYGFAISGQGIAMLFLFSDRMNLWIVLMSVVLIIYGLRLSGYLLIRELKSKSYQNHMVNEIKDGSTMPFFVKLMLWLTCGLLYMTMVLPIYLRFANGNIEATPTYILGILCMVSGILLESMADYQKNQMKKANPKRFCDKGLFSFVRCPNYLGELILWTGVLIAGITSLHGVSQWVLALFGYIGIVFVMFSGARRLEVRQNRNYGADPEYQTYVKTVPIMLPFIPLYSVEKYKFLVL